MWPTNKPTIRAVGLCQKWLDNPATLIILNYSYDNGFVCHCFFITFLISLWTMAKLFAFMKDVSNCEGSLIMYPLLSLMFCKMTFNRVCIYSRCYRLTGTAGQCLYLEWRFLVMPQKSCRYNNGFHASPSFFLSNYWFIVEVFLKKYCNIWRGVSDREIVT